MKYYECVCVFLPQLPGMQTHLFSAALCCHLWPVCFYLIFPRHLTNVITFGKKLYGMYILYFDFFYKFFRNISHFKKNSAGE